MLRHLGLIAVCACIVASVGCDGGKLPDTAPSPPPATVSVEFGGRGQLRCGRPRRERAGIARERGIFRREWCGTFQRARPDGWVFPTDTATSGGDGTLPSDSISRVLGRMSDLKSPFRLNTTIRASGSIGTLPQIVR